MSTLKNGFSQLTFDHTPSVCAQFLKLVSSLSNTSLTLVTTCKRLSALWLAWRSPLGGSGLAARPQTVCMRVTRSCYCARGRRVPHSSIYRARESSGVAGATIFQLRGYYKLNCRSRKHEARKNGQAGRQAFTACGQYRMFPAKSF